MRLALALAALASTTALSQAYGVYPKCTDAQTQQFVDNLDKASNDCTATSSYEWDGNDDPTSAERHELCKCTVGPLEVPKCSWIKADVYNVSVNEHFHYVYNCKDISGKSTPIVTEVPAANATEAPSPALKACAASEVNAFTTALKKASPCLASASYDWGGPKDPTDAEYAELCKCTAVGDMTIPSCSLKKQTTTVSLSEHYNWVLKTQCPKFSSHSGPYPKCTAAGTQQFIDSLSAASNGCTDDISYEWDGNSDPTTAQCQEICKCAVGPFEIPKCSWIKADVYNVSVNEHFHFAYNCKNISGKATPNVTEVPMTTEVAVRTHASEATFSGSSAIIVGVMAGAVAAAVVLIIAVFWQRKRTQKQAMDVEENVQAPKTAIKEDDEGSSKMATKEDSV